MINILTRRAATLAALATLLPITAFAQTANFWDGSESTNWNEPLNWLGNVTPANQQAIINVSGANVATLSVPWTGSPANILIGDRSGANGRLDHIAAAFSLPVGSPLTIGTNGGGGIYNLADTSQTGAGLTGFGTGSGFMNLTMGSSHQSGMITVGGGAMFSQQTGSSGILNVNTSGGIGTTGTIRVGSSYGANGVLNLESGTVSTGSLEVGYSGGTGTVNIYGGSLEVVQSSPLTLGSSWRDDSAPTGVTRGTGILNISGGQLKASTIYVGGGADATGSMTMSGGTVTTDRTVNIGYIGGSGSLNMSGGTWSRTGGSLNIGSDGPGVMTHSGGLMNFEAGNMRVGDRPERPGLYTLTGNGEARANQFIVGAQTGSVGEARLHGGNLMVGQLLGGAGQSTVSFDGATVTAANSLSNFISNIDSATIENGGLRVDTRYFDVAADQSFSGEGGLTKSGVGKLTLTGSNTFAGLISIEQGTLGVGSSGSVSNAAGITLSAGATLDLSDVGSFRLTSDRTLSGNGRIMGGQLLVGSEASLAPGLSIGTLDVDGGLTFEAGSQFAVEISPALGSSDLVSLGGGLDIDPAASLALSLFGDDAVLDEGFKMALIEYEGAWNGGAFQDFADGETRVLGLNRYQIDYDDTTFGGTAVTLTVVPEISSLWLAVLGALSLARRRR